MAKFALANGERVVDTPKGPAIPFTPKQNSERDEVIKDLVDRIVALLRQCRNESA